MITKSIAAGQWRNYKTVLSKFVAVHRFSPGYFKGCAIVLHVQRLTAAENVCPPLCQPPDNQITSLANWQLMYHVRLFLPTLSEGKGG